MKFPNPLGLAAGCDKDARAVDGFFAMGFGFVEVGTVTLWPQPGNPAPRLFRLEADQALINRLGFNSAGAEVAAARLEGGAAGIVGVNLGPNRDAASPISDLATLARRFRPLADYLAVNVSSPNTPGLRDFQSPSRLAQMIDALNHDSDGTPTLIKVSPDLGLEARASIADLLVAKGVDGLIVANTTTDRPSLRGDHAHEVGGLSGKPLFGPSTALLSEMYRLTKGRVPIIAAGGVFSGADAFAKICAGASLVQLYTGLVYRGPAIVGDILGDLDRRLAEGGFATFADAVGADHR